MSRIPSTLLSMVCILPNSGSIKLRSFYWLLNAAREKVQIHSALLPMSPPTAGWYLNVSR